ncbi:MAG: translation initiation factor IF-2 N-terminal domain-containing protein, partial [Actinomycetota bacterium]
MAGKRVHQLAKELGISSKELLEVLHAMGEDIQNPLSSISEGVEKEAVKRLAKPRAEKPRKKAAAKEKPDHKAETAPPEAKKAA